MEAAGIEVSHGLLWDHRSANARAVLGFMEGYCTRIELTNSTRFHIPSAQNEHSHVLGASHVSLLFCSKGFSSFTTNAELRVLILKTHSKVMR